MKLIRHEGAKGQGLVEFALVLPVILLLVVGLFDAGRGVIFYTELANASRVGARVAIVNQSDDSSCLSPDRTFKCAAAEITTGMDITPSSIADLVLAGADCALPSNCTATVTVTYPFTLITPLIDTLIGPINLTASTTMPLERNYSTP